MKSRGTSVWPWILFGSTVLLMGAAIFLGRRSAAAGVGQLNPADIAWGTSWLALPAVGALIASRRPGNKVGWLACSFGLPIALLLFADEYASYALYVSPGSLPGAKFMLWLSQWPFYVSGGVAVFIFLLFPDGQLPSRRWRPFAWMAVAATILGALAASFGQITEKGSVENPLAIQSLSGPLETIQEMAGTVLLGLVVLSLVSTFIRLRRARGDARRQLKWFFLGLAFMLAMFLLIFALEEVARLGAPESFFTIIFVLGVLGPPAGIAIAVLKHRLYDIDVVINKTVVYSGLAAFITAVYVGVVVGIGALVGSGDKPNLGLSLVATAIVAVAFQPVRERVQRFANKLIYGERVTPYEAITGFSHRMAESLSLDLVLPQMAEAAAKGVGGIRSRVQLLLPGGSEQVVTWPDDSSENSFDRTLAVVHQGEEMGEIAVAKAPGDQINSSEEKLLTDLASQAGLAMRNLRLTGELQQKLVELQASRQRIVKAQDEERRRMERDIHDGAQQQLVSMSVKLGLVRNLLTRDAEKAGAPIVVSLDYEDGQLLFSVRDEGSGFDPKTVKMGSGLQNMADRVEALGGTFGMETGPRLGTAISGRVPVSILVPAR